MATSWNQDREKLIDLISQTYSTSLSSSTLTADQAITVISLVNVLCGSSTKCEQCKVDSGCPNCSYTPEACKGTYVGDDDIERKICPTNCSDCVNSFRPEDIPETLEPCNPGIGLPPGTRCTRRFNYRYEMGVGVCSGSCLCSIEGQINQQVMFVGGVIEDITPADINKIISQVVTSYNEYIKNDESKTPIQPDQVRKIIQDHGFEEDIRSNIMQMLVAAQIVEIEGAGTITALRLDMAIDAVFNALVSNRNRMDMVGEVVSDSRQFMIDFIDESIMNAFTRLWEQNKTFYIRLFIILGVLTLLIIIMTIWLAFTKK